MRENFEDKIIYCKFAIVLLRIMYVFVAFLSIMFITDGEYIQATIIGLFCVAVIITNIFIKSYKKKLEKSLENQYAEYETKKAEIMKERQQMADEINKSMKFEVDKSKIVYTENDKKRIEKNCKIMKKKGLPYMEQMKLIPSELLVNIKSKEEIAKQMIADYFLARKAYNRLQGISDVQDQGLVQNVFKYQLMANQNVMGIFTQISNGEVDEITLNELVYLFERANVYMWILGLTYKPLPNKQCFLAGLTMIIEKYNSMDELINNCKMISNEEILGYADLITRYEWAMYELNKIGKKSKNLNNDSVLEQKKAMDWVTSFNPDNLLKQE